MTTDELNDWKSYITAKDVGINDDKAYKVDYKDDENKKPNFIRFDGETNTF